MTSMMISLIHHQLKSHFIMLHSLQLWLRDSILRPLNLFKNIITDTIEGKDALVVQPTGSGKSLCFLFPPVYLNKKAIIVTPTISVMQDQVHKLNDIQVPSVFLGSAQFD